MAKEICADCEKVFEPKCKKRLYAQLATKSG